MILTRYQPDEFDRWLKANLPDLVRPDNPLGLYNEEGQTVVDHSLWPPAANGGRPPTVEEVAEFNPLTDVEIMAKLFAEAQAAAPAYLNQLKGTVWAALVAGGMSQAEATAAGVALVIRHAAPLAAFEAAGGHPDAAAALYAAIASEASVAALPWLTAPILAIFSAALTPGK